jgi:hypothetical protein
VKESGLGDGHPLGRPTEVAVTRNRHEVLELTQLHGRTLSSGESEPLS